MEFQTWLIYFLAVIGLSLSPGPNGLLALSHGALYGHRKALYTLSGGAIGFVLVIALSMFGIGAVLQTSAEAINVMRWIGGAYLIWLGIQLWRSPPVELSNSDNTPQRSGMALFSQGLLSAITNPKVLLFFGAFLPQFIDPTASLFTQFLVMATTFAVVEFLVEYLLARLSFRIRPWLQRCGKAFNRSCGGLFAAIGASLPLSQG